MGNLKVQIARLTLCIMKYNCLSILSIYVCNYNYLFIQLYFLYLKKKQNKYNAELPNTFKSRYYLEIYV